MPSSTRPVRPFPIPPFGGTSAFPVHFITKRQIMRASRYGSLLVGSVAAFAIAAVSSLSAQEAAVITGKVTGQAGEGLGGANVVVANSNFGRSGERRVGKECRSRWWPYH